MLPVSIVIPLYNKEDYISNTIKSVLSQSYADFEIVVVNDGSTDSSLNKVRQIQDSRIRVIDKLNEGVSKTRNRGVKEASYDLIYFLDADDLMYPECLTTLMDLHNNYPDADLWSGNYVKTDNNKDNIVLSTELEGYIEEPHKYIYRKNWHFCPGSYLITKNSFFKNQEFQDYITVGEDYFFMDRYCSNFKCAYTPKIIFSYIQEHRSLSRNTIDYHKTVEWHFDFKKANHWQRLAYSELISKRVLKAVVHGYWKEARDLFSKYGLFYNMLGIYAILRNMGMNMKAAVNMIRN